MVYVTVTVVVPFFFCDVTGRDEGQQEGPPRRARDPRASGTVRRFRADQGGVGQPQAFVGGERDVGSGGGLYP